MSTKKIDELFRVKLEGHPVNPSPEAWAKLQGKMHPAGRKKGAIWMSIAATISLTILAGWFVYRQNESGLKQQNTMADQIEPLGKPAQVEPKVGIDEKSENLVAKTGEAQNEIVETVPAAGKSPSAKKISAEPAKAPAKKIMRSVQPTALLVASASQREDLREEAMIALEEISKAGEVAENTSIPEAITLDKTDANLVAEMQEPVEPMEVKITFKADEENDRFLDSVRDLIESELPKEKKNGFNRLLASARTFSNRDILAELRDTKDELLSGSIRLGIIKNEKVNNSK